MTDRMGEFERSLEFQSVLVKDTDEKYMRKMKKMERNLDDKIKLLDQKLMMLEKQDRKYNLLFYGIPEEPDEKLYEKMRHFFMAELKIAKERAQTIHFMNGHRYPSRGAGPNPVILRFTSFEDRQLVLSHAKNLLNTKKRILTDLPISMKKERDRIAKLAYEIRQTEKLQTRIKDKGLDVYLEVRKENKDKWVRRNVEKEDDEVEIEEED